MLVQSARNFAAFHSRDFSWLWGQGVSIYDIFVLAKLPNIWHAISNFPKHTERIHKKNILLNWYLYLIATLDWPKSLPSWVMSNVFNGSWTSNIPVKERANDPMLGRETCGCELPNHRDAADRQPREVAEVLRMYREGIFKDTSDICGSFVLPWAEDSQPHCRCWSKK